MPSIGMARFESNLDRVKNLIDIYENKLAGAGGGRRPAASTDLLRAAVVFLHASVEDYLRYVARILLPGSSVESLDNIPLVGICDKGPAKKFLLGALTAHRGKTVDAVLIESVSAFLSRETYNNTTDIAVLLNYVDIDVAQVNGRFDDINEMMERRHHIVHQADLNTTHGRGHHGVQGLNKKTVRRWAEAVEEFVAAVDRQLP